VQRLVAQVYVGIRGRALTNLCANFDLQIANDGDDEAVVASWTFCSLMGLIRKIDLILCSGTFTLSKSFAANQLELASDHRAVYYPGVKFPRRNQNRHNKHKRKTHEYGNRNALVCITPHYLCNSVILSLHLIKDWKGLCRELRRPFTKKNIQYV